MSSLRPSLIGVLLQFLASAAAGAVLAVIGGMVGSALGKSNPSGWGDLIGGVLLSAAGYVIGTVLGATLAGRRLNRPTSLPLALIGAVAAAILVLILAEPLHLNSSAIVLQAVMGAAVPAAAVFVPGLFQKK